MCDIRLFACKIADADLQELFTTTISMLISLRRQLHSLFPALKWHDSAVALAKGPFTVLAVMSIVLREASELTNDSHRLH